MQIIKKEADTIVKEDAHGGSGQRRVYADGNGLANDHLEAVTHGYLPGGNSYDWHEHDGVEELMIVLVGSGEVHDEDAVYRYAPGDVFTFPANVKHKIYNTTETEHEMLFIRVKV